MTGRRPVVEAVFAAAAEQEPGVSVRRGVRVTGLLAGSAAVPGVPHVAGVRSTTGEELRADLVVDATGRRTPSPDWLAGLGARPALIEPEDHGFAYYTRFFTGPARPPQRGRALVPLGSVSLLTLTPFYRNQVAADRARIAEITALRAGVEPPAPDSMAARLLAAAAHDPDAFRGLIEIVLCLAQPHDVLSRPAVAAAIDRRYDRVGVPGPDRAQLVELLAA